MTATEPREGCPDPSGESRPPPSTARAVRTAGTGCWAARPAREPVTHEGRQAVRGKAGAPQLRGVRHAVGEGLSGGAARRAARAPGAPTRHSLEAEATRALGPIRLLLAVAQEARGPGARRQRAEGHRERRRRSHGTCASPGPGTGGHSRADLRPARKAFGRAPLTEPGRRSLGRRAQLPGRRLVTGRGLGAGLGYGARPARRGRG